MTDLETGLVCFSALAAVLVVAAAWLLVRKDASAAELVRQGYARDDAREARRERGEAAAAELAARRERRDAGPRDGALLGVHVGAQVIRGTRVLRDAPEADGWTVLADAEMLDGGKSTPLGGRQWLAGASWIQELKE